MDLLLSGFSPATRPLRPLNTGILYVLVLGAARDERKRSCKPSSISRVSVVCWRAAIDLADASKVSLISSVVFIREYNTEICIASQFTVKKGGCGQSGGQVALIS